MKDKPSYYMMGNIKLQRIFKVVHSPCVDIKYNNDWICTECGAEGTSNEKTWHWESCSYALRQTIMDLCTRCGVGPGW